MFAQPVTFQRAYSGAAFGATVSERIDKLVAQPNITQVAAVDALPAGVPEKTIDEAEKEFGRPWYKKWWVLALIGLGVVGAGTTTYFVFRKKRRRKR